MQAGAGAGEEVAFDGVADVEDELGVGRGDADVGGELGEVVGYDAGVVSTATLVPSQNQESEKKEETRKRGKMDVIRTCSPRTGRTTQTSR